MSVSSTKLRTRYQADGVTTVFTFPFEILSLTELSVYLTPPTVVASARLSSHAYTAGQVITVGDNAGLYFQCTTAGTTASSEPLSYPSATNGTFVADGTTIFYATINPRQPQLLTYGTDYSVTGGVLNPSGGTVTFVDVPPSGYTITIIRNSNELQLDSFGTGEGVPSQAYEQALDRLTLLAQELNDKIARTPGLSPSVDPTTLSLAFPLSTMDGNIQYIAWNAAGTALIVNELISLGTITITPFGTNLVNCADAPTARALLLSGAITGSDLFAVATGSANTYNVTVNSVITSYTAGLTVRFKANAANSGGCLLNVNALGLKNLLKNGSQPLISGDIYLNQMCIATYDGTNFQLNNPSSATIVGTVGIANGGTGQVTQQTAINALVSTHATGTYLRGNGSNAVMSSILASDVPTLNQNTTGNAGSVTNGLYTTNIGTSVPSPTGTGASGTWPINISGSSGSTASANLATAVGVVGASLKLIAVGTFNGAGGGSTFLALNCLIAKNSFGNYSVTFVNFPADGNYIVSLNARSTLVAGGLFANVLNGQTAFGFTIQVWNQNNTPVDPVVDFTVWHA